MNLALFIRALVALVLGLFGANACLGQDIHENDEVTQLAEQLMAETFSPGAGIAILRGGQVTFGYAGVRQAGRTESIEATDLWHMGSNTKAMTATLVARLVDAGQIRWEDTVADHLGNHIPELRAEYAEVTFIDLLSHRSGLRSNLSFRALFHFGGAAADGVPLPEQRIEFARRALTSAPETTPRTEFNYSNSGYVVVAAMIESATGKGWETLIEEEVFEPLSMESAGFGAPGSRETISQPRGHSRGIFGHPSPAEPGLLADNPPVMSPAGGVHISLPDLMKFLSAHMTQSGPDGEAYLSPESWTTLHTDPYGGGYAMGWGLYDGRLMHSGSNRRWVARVDIDPARDLAIALATNYGNLDRFQESASSIIDEIRNNSANVSAE